MSIEQRINYQLNKFPRFKRIIKRTYQVGMYVLSHKIKSEGEIERISPNDDKEYFFGYYDKSPWDSSNRYILCLRANNTWKDVSPKEKADIIVIDTEKSKEDKNRIRKVAETRTWNVQQGCMLQWLGPDFSRRIIYNDFRDGIYCSVILDITSGRETVIKAPVYSVSTDGRMALSLDFSRLYNLRPGYGYYNVKEETEGVSLPDSTAIWKIDIESGNITKLLKYTDFASFNPRQEMMVEKAIHKVNHIMISPNGKRFMVLYRWFVGHRKYTRLITCDVDGTNMYLLSDEDMVSHCCWKDDNTILAFENKYKSGPGYYLMKDKSNEYIHLWQKISNDGHPSYSPQKENVVIDSYPNRARISEIKVLQDTDNNGENIRVISKVFSPFKYDNDTRCDLHPRWNRTGNAICFDAVFEGKRGLYLVNINE